MIALLFATLLQASAAAPDTATYASKSDYRVVPSAYDWYLATPQLVHGRGLAGKVTLLCKVTDFGDLARCQVKDEEPKGYGFGKAAKTLSTKMKMVPTPKGETRWLLVPFAWERGGPYLPPSAP